MININNNIQIIYYAHSLNIYDTQLEKKELKTINKEFPSSIIINPNGWICQNMSGNDIMKQCLLFAGKICNTVIFSADAKGIIGKGVYEELREALKYNKDVFYLTKNSFIRFNSNNFNNIKMLYAETGSWKKYAQVVLSKQ